MLTDRGKRTEVAVNGPQTVAARVSAEIAANRLQFDLAQHTAALQLDGLSAQLRAGASTRVRRLRATMPWLLQKTPPTAPRGVYLWGGVGRGKTMLMDFFYATVEDAQRSHFYHFMRNVHARLAALKRRTDPLEVLAQQLANRTRVICLDEFFVGDIADAMILAGLFAGLFRRGVVLVATSNLAPRDLYKDGLQRQRFLPAIDLLNAHLDVVHLDGGIDYRLRQLEQAPTYLNSAGPETAALMRERFAALSGAITSGPAVLEVEGRPLRAVDVAQDSAWFQFSELCEGPRSQNDYIELARLYSTIFLSDVPIFDHEAENAARRFIMLIDELYDRGVKLVVSAAAAPHELYHGERLRLEFERAASRLIEMQTRQYLAGEHRP